MKKLTQSDIPPGYNYAAVDKSGLTRAYKEKPILLETSWYHSSVSRLLTGRNKSLLIEEAVVKYLKGKQK
jgi:hypothetical protein